ncbi:hypothetical protein JL722_2878 [Aureococcus anophagefferens]|nr:hypothetical protein JL722_2878 [Aureococcus anophagefferens]
MAATRARAFALLCLVAAARAGPKVRKPPKVELDESKLPPLESVLAELGVADVLPQLQAKGLDSTRQLCKWSRSDVSIHGMELGWWFGARLPESPLPMVMAAPRNGCAPLPPAIYAGAVVLADRGGCGFVEKAWVAHAAGARAVAVLNAADGPFDRPTAGYATDAEVTPSPGDVAVALLHHDAKNGLKDAAARPSSRSGRRGHRDAGDGPRGGGCSFAVKAVHAAALGAAVLAVAQNDSAPLLRMGIRFPPAPPPVAGISVGEAGEAALLALAASGNATRPAYASLELAKPPGFAHKWLELSGAEPWPEDEANAAKERKKLAEKNADSPHRLAWLERSYAAARAADGCA